MAHPIPSKLDATCQTKIKSALSFSWHETLHQPVHNLSQQPISFRSVLSAGALLFSIQKLDRSLNRLRTSGEAQSEEIISILNRACVVFGQVSDVHDSPIIICGVERFFRGRKVAYVCDPLLLTTDANVTVSPNVCDPQRLEVPVDDASIGRRGSRDLNDNVLNMPQGALVTCRSLRPPKVLDHASEAIESCHPGRAAGVKGIPETTSAARKLEIKNVLAVVDWKSLGEDLLVH